MAKFEDLKIGQWALVALDGFIDSSPILIEGLVEPNPDSWTQGLVQFRYNRPNGRMHHHMPKTIVKTYDTKEECDLVLKSLSVYNDFIEKQMFDRKAFKNELLIKTGLLVNFNDRQL